MIIDLKNIVIILPSLQSKMVVFWEIIVFHHDDLVTT